MSDIGVNRVREVYGGGAARKRLDLPLRREGVDLVGIQLDLEVLDEFLRIADLLLEQLPHPLKEALVLVVSDAAFLVFPVRRDAFLGHPMHFHRPDLDLERHTVLADDRGVQ